MPVALTGADATWLIRPTTTWVKPALHPVWWNADAGRWDAILPRDTGGSDDHYIAMDIEDGSPTYGPSINGQSTTRPDVWWDESSGTLYVLFGHQSSCTLVVCSYSGGTYSIDNSFSVDDIQIEQDGYDTEVDPDGSARDNNESPVALYVTPNGHIWVANTALHRNPTSGPDSETEDPRVEVARSTDGGDTWSTVTLTTSTIEGATVMGHVTDSGTTRLVLYSSQNSGGGYNAWSIDQDTGSIAAGNWASESIPAPVGDEDSDDHVCAVTHDGAMFVAYKTGGPTSSEPLIGLHVRESDGGWSRHTVVLGPDTSPRPTRPSIVIDSGNEVMHLFYAEIEGDQRVMHMTADLSDLDTWSSPVALIDDAGNWWRGLITPREPVTSVTDLAGIAYEDGDNDLWVETVTIDAPSGATVEGTADVSLGGLSLSASGKRVVNGSASVTLGGLSVAATGRRTVHGSADVNLGALTLTGTGSRVVHGTANVALGGLTLSATGRRTVYGSASVPLGGLDVTATGTRTVHGSADVTFGGLGLSAVGEVEGSTAGTADITLGALTVTATGKRVVHGSADVQLGGLNLAGTGQASGATVGQAEVTLGGLDVTATGHRVVHGEASITLGALTLTAQIEPPTPIVLPPYREQAVPDYMEAAVPAYRERAVPAYQESAS